MTTVTNLKNYEVFIKIRSCRCFKMSKKKSVIVRSNRYWCLFQSDRKISLRESNFALITKLVQIVKNQFYRSTLSIRVAKQTKILDASVSVLEIS